MIKYVDIKGYKNLGEVQPFSHLYQMIEMGKETPITILIHAYECEPKIFKGYVFNITKTFKSVPLHEEEKSVIDYYIGKSKQVSFNDFIVGTIAEEYYSNFTEAEQ